ncbi:Vsp/OspC family lipoprotein (plasmid) [Borrelia puertoricensis]|uniref:Vsp/OspC family lipoprotein n=1 Tax=Borrelia puertoricensis TaxID=2756107 RepID=UPI003EBED8F8
MKRITLCALFLTLFLLLSCNTSGKNLTDDEVAKSDGTVIDLAKITKNITDSVAFAKSVKEVHTLVKSIDTLAKAIGKKIKDGGGLDTENDKNGSLIAGAYNVALDIQAKLLALETKTADNELKKQVTEAKTSSTEFINKVKGAHTDLGKNDAKDEDAKKAIDISDATGDKGAADLVKLNTEIGKLLTAAEAAVTSAINALTTPAKP